MPAAASCNLDLPLRWAEPLLITPRLHRHHRVPATTNCNFGTVLSIGDRVAGTLVVADTAPQEPIGVPGELATYPQRLPDAVRQPLRQFRAQARIRSRFTVDIWSPGV